VCGGEDKRIYVWKTNGTYVTSASLIPTGSGTEELLT
jgi:hypothetical protein